MMRFGCAVDERRMRMSRLIGVAGSNPSCRGFRPEPKDSQLEGARSIAVVPVAAHDSLADKAVKRIADTRSASRAEEPFGNGAIITSAEKPACCGRH